MLVRMDKEERGGSSTARKTTICPRCFRFTDDRNATEVIRGARYDYARVCRHEPVSGRLFDGIPTR